MDRRQFSLELRDHGAIALAASAGLVAGFAAFHYVLPLSDWLGISAAPAASLLAAAGLGAWTATAVALLRIHALRKRIAKARIALDNMSQGLCMFDSNERLLVCNARYRQMYDLSEQHIAPGTSLAELLEYRAGAGNFSVNVAAYRAQLAASLAEGKAASGEVVSDDGRLTSVVNRPMPGGGWVATHEDITDRRAAERERLGIQ
jgi:methyl-accepting chemotaxis protein